ncbi:MAG: nucleotidyltransferase family protein, partial [Candidatus Woesearchaeota archaeon]
MIRAILLAAGKGSRMGVEKQLLNWKDSSLLKESIENLIEVNKVDEIRVVLGYKAQKIKNNIDGFENKKIKFLINKDYENGMHTTIKKGLENINEKINHILISLGDQPFIDKNLYEQVIDKYLSVDKDILVPTYEGKRGHPVLIKKELLLSEIDDLEGPGGLRTLIKDKKELVYFYELDKQEVVIDLDYYDEYKLYRKKKAVENNSLFLNYKFWLEGEKKVFGDGPCDILVR